MDEHERLVDHIIARCDRDFLECVRGWGPASFRWFCGVRSLHADPSRIVDTMPVDPAKLQRQYATSRFAQIGLEEGCPDLAQRLPWNAISVKLAQ